MDKKKNGFALIAVAVTSFYLGSISTHWFSSEKIELSGPVESLDQSKSGIIKPVYEMPSKASPELEIMLENKDKKIAVLTNKLSIDKEQYQQRIDELNIQLSNLQNLADTTIPLPLSEEAPLTKEQVERHLAAPFSALMIGTNKKAKELFNALHGEKNNEQWTYSIMNHINDFIQMHEFSNQLTSFNTKCNGSTCQISGFEIEPDIWAKIEADLKSQDWWEFDYLRSASSNNIGKSRFFYVLASKNS